MIEYIILVFLVIIAVFAYLIYQKVNTKEDAIRYAEENSIKYTLSDPKERRIKPKAYADNFSFNRKETWTH